MCFSVLVEVCGGVGVVYISMYFFFLPVDCTLLAAFLRAAHRACGVRRYKAAFF